MKPAHRVTASLFALIVLAPLAQAAPSGAQGRSCHLPGVEEALRCVSVAVPLDYQQPAASSLKLHVTLAPAFREAARGDPLFVLAGGPGQAGSDVLALLGATLHKVRATRDIVFIDQRGTGLSGKLDCDSAPGQDNASEADAEREASTCLASLKQPLAMYTTEAAARDVEQVRRALGYGKINLWGGSYGTRLGQAYARAFPDSTRALILDGVAAPEQIIPAGGHDAQAALDGLFKACAANAGCAAAFPALRSEFAALLERTAGNQVQIDVADPRTAQPRHVSISTERFIGTVHTVLYSPVDSRRLPFLIHSAYQGNWAPFLARSNAASDFSSDGASAFGLHLAVVCAEDMPRMSAQVLAEDARGSFMGSALSARFARLCELAKVPAVPYRTPSKIAAPVLMFSGALDPVTPPRRAEAAARYMTAAQHFVVANAGHGVSQLGCAPRLLREFLDHPDAPLAAKCLQEIPATSFQLGSAGPQP